MKQINSLDINLLSNENLKIINARSEQGNDSVVTELKLLDEDNGDIYYFILNHLDLGPMEAYLLDKSIYSRLKRIGDYTEQAFIDFINDNVLDIELDELDIEEIEALPYSKAILIILMLNDDCEIAKELKNKHLKDVDTSEFCI